MQMGYDFNAARPEGDPVDRAVMRGEAFRPDDGRDADGSALRHPEWASLRARFLALHALRRAMPAPVSDPLPAGGFAVASESVLFGCRHGEAVNPVYWANLKEDSVNTSPVAASPTRGDRGMA